YRRAWPDGVGRLTRRSAGQFLDRLRGKRTARTWADVLFVQVRAWLDTYGSVQHSRRSPPADEPLGSVAWVGGATGVEGRLSTGKSGILREPGPRSHASPVRCPLRHGVRRGRARPAQ